MGSEVKGGSRLDRGASFLQAQREGLLRKALLRAEGVLGGRVQPADAEGRLGAERTEVEEQGLRTRHDQQRPGFSTDSVCDLGRVTAPRFSMK